ncbi:MAG: TIGR00730 family Rossman fold protein [Ruminococcaceae bacterium]|nr:TIGR00730 family Rossman fold protein [Oscillospiraceae bacterium]
MNICVFGAASNEIDNSYITAVEALGEEMAKRGHTLVFGAGGNGLMGAVARGVHRGGSKIIGVIPSFFKIENVEKIFENCTELIYTETMAQRKAKMEDLADAFIIVPGGIGTFEEFFEVLTLKQLCRHTKPIAIVDHRNYYKKLENFLDHSMQEGFVRDNCKKLYHYTTDHIDALRYIEDDQPIRQNVHDLKNG